MSKTLLEVGSLAFRKAMSSPGAPSQRLQEPQPCPALSLLPGKCSAPPLAGLEHSTQNPRKVLRLSKTRVAPTEGLLLSLQEMGIPVPGQSSPRMKEREADQIT